MSEKIQTRVFRAGDPKESEWPPLFGTGGKGGLFYIDKESGKLKEGYPPPTIKRFGEAPYIIQDSIEPYYHPAAESWIDSRSALNRVDKACGTITSDRILPADPTAQKQKEYERKLDAHEALHKSVAQIDNGTAPLSEETKALCEIQNKIVSDSLGMDAFNAVGKVTNPKGKRYKAMKAKKVKNAG